MGLCRLLWDGSCTYLHRSDLLLHVSRGLEGSRLVCNYRMDSFCPYGSLQPVQLQPRLRHLTRHRVDLKHRLALLRRWKGVQNVLDDRNRSSQGGTYHDWSLAFSCRLHTPLFFRFFGKKMGVDPKQQAGPLHRNRRTSHGSNRLPPISSRSIPSDVSPAIVAD